MERVVNATAEEERHLAVRAGHCVELNDADTAAWDAGDRTLDKPADGDVTELVDQPCGPDIRRELE